MTHKINNIKLIPLYLLLLSTLGTAGLSKLYEGSVPAWFMLQFHDTPFDRFSGSLSISYFLIASLEALSAFFLLVSLVQREFLPARNKPLLHTGLLLSQLTFVALSFGERLTHKYSEAFELFAYALLVFLAQQVLFRKEPVLT